MATKFALRQRLYNFLGHPALKYAKQDTRKAPSKVFAFGRPPAVRKHPAGG